MGKLNRGHDGDPEVAVENSDVDGFHRDQPLVTAGSW
jgi:hypothetical protein